MNTLPEDFTISTDPTKLNPEMVYHFLNKEAYWSKGIPYETFLKSIEHSLNFILLHKEKQVGFARIITDYATIAYLGDVFISSDYRGLGLSKCLIQSVMNCPELQGLRRWILLTQDAHELYRQFGWSPIQNPERWMELHNKYVYKAG